MLDVGRWRSREVDWVLDVGRWRSREVDWLLDVSRCSTCSRSV